MVNSRRDSKSGNKRSRMRARAPNWLPDGWIMDVAVDESGNKVKYYTSPVSGHTFQSKQEVLRHLKVTKVDGHVSETTSSSGHNKQIVVSQVKDSPEWLPRGWILEIKTRLSGQSAGQKYKCYFDPSTGSRFYSKAEVFRFLKSGNICSPAFSEKSRFKASTTDNVLAQIEYSPDGLPHGWIKEIKFKKSNGKIRRDPYYTDPVSGYIFRSLKDAVHYVETGELSKHAFGPKKRNISEVYSLEKESSPPIPVYELKSQGSTLRQCLFTEGTPAKNQEMVIEINDSPKKLLLLPPDDVSSNFQKADSTYSSPDIEHMEGKADNKRREVLDPETDSSRDISKHSKGKGKGKRGRPNRKMARPAKQSKEMEQNSCENVLEQAKVVENPSEPSEPTREITLVPQERKQQRRKGKSVTLPSRSSKRLAGLEPAPATELMDRRLSRRSTSNGGCNRIEELVPLADPESTVIAEEGSIVDQVVLTGKTSEDRPSSPLALPFGDSWPDPCIEFAVKTLMGEIPLLDEGIALEEYIQKQLSSVEMSDPGVLGAVDFSQGMDQAKLHAPMELPEKQHLPVDDEGKSCPLENGLPSHGKASKKCLLSAR